MPILSGAPAAPDPKTKGFVQMIYFMALALALGFGVPVAVLSAALGQGKALEGMARQPEQTGKIQTAMILSLAFIESLVIFSLLVFFLMQGKLPNTDKVMEAVTTQAQQK